MNRSVCLACDGVGYVMVAASVGVAWTEGVNWGVAATGLTVSGGIVLGFGIKAWKDITTTRAEGIAKVQEAEAEGIARVEKARAEGIIEIEKARAEANAYKRRLEMTVESEWEAQNAVSLKGQLEKLQHAVEEDRERTEDANKKLHEIRNEFQVATLQHAEQRAALIAQVGALTESLEAARREIAEFHRREQAKLQTVAAGQARQDVVIEETKVAVSEAKAATEVNAAAIGETQAAIERLGGGVAGEGTVVGPEGQG